MPKIKYQEFNFRENTLSMITQANAIIDEYTAQGYDLTLRQLYYQFVARAVIVNNERSYKNLASIINDGRLAGMIDWNAITDRTRNLRSLATWNNPQSIIGACAEQFRYDKWREQSHYCEVWIEKDALVGVIEGICNDLQVPHFSCRGYTSASEMWIAAQRFRSMTKLGKECVMFHLGDHDPSGIDMTRDIEDRLRLFGARVEVERLALNYDQVEQYNPPPNPAKLTDARATGYVAEHGGSSWELDALEPSVLTELVRTAVYEIRDVKKWKTVVKLEEHAKETLKKIADRYSDVHDFLHS